MYLLSLLINVMHAYWIKLLVILIKQIILKLNVTVKKNLSQHKIWRQPASADFGVLSTCCFEFIQQKVENLLQK